MDFEHIKTVQSCLENIKTLEGIGYPVPQELLDRLEVLKNAEKTAEIKKQNEGIYEHFARTVGYSDELKHCIETTVDKLSEDGPDAKKPGLLLGKIQCGKTRAFVGIIGLAFDKGFDACIVLTKGTNALVEQTVTRLKGDFKYFLGLGSHGSSSVEIYDIMKLPNNGLTIAQINNQKNIIVCKKEHINVTHLLELFTVQSPELAGKKILIVDDEADFVSHNFITQKQQIYVGTVTYLIDQFVRVPSYCRYLQVTATPYSLYLQPDHEINVVNGKVEPFRPRFTSLVPIHANYIGGQQYFVESKNNNSMYSHLFHHISDECFDRMLVQRRDQRLINNVTGTPKFTDLRWALMSYFVGSAIRKIQVKKETGRTYLTSFLMHVSTAQNDHEWQTELVNALLDAWCANTSAIKKLFGEVFEDMSASINKGIKEGLLSVSAPVEDEVWDKVKELLEQRLYLVQPVNSQVSVTALLDANGQLRLTHELNIFIGGFVLDRGITIDHMLGFMYGRRPSVEQQDTVLQHCRMYGNRSKEDMSVTRLHTTAKLFNIMERMDLMDDQLREWFINYQKNGMQGDPSSVFVNLSDNNKIIPCSRQKLAISNVTTLKPFKRITTYGFQTDCASKIRGTVDALDTMITSQPNYVKDAVFEIDVKVVIGILKRIRSTFIYSRPIDNNAAYEWDENEMIGCIEYATQDTNGKMLCLHRTNRNMRRVRQNGNFVDAPEDGNTDTPLARANATTMPVIMLFRENGDESLGWRDTPFYWPSLMLPENLTPAIFSTQVNDQ